jgi:FtsP/CotA-like multicopper oxidase with cupredoxin domain
VRVNLINDTMMPHPIHLHGHFFEVVTGNPGHHPRKHTVNVLPGGKVSFDLTADAIARRLGVSLPHAAAHACRGCSAS